MSPENVQGTCEACDAVSGPVNACTTHWQAVLSEMNEPSVSDSWVDWKCSRHIVDDNQKANLRLGGLITEVLDPNLTIDSRKRRRYP